MKKSNWISLDQSRTRTVDFIPCSPWTGTAKSAASLCKTTDGETATKFLEQFCNLNGIPKTIRTHKATDFTGRQFRNFRKNKFIKIIYETPYIHTATGLVERGVRPLKEKLLTNIMAGEPFGKALNLALNVMRTTPHTG